MEVGTNRPVCSRAFSVRGANVPPLWTATHSESVLVKETYGKGVTVVVLARKDGERSSLGARAADDHFCGPDKDLQIQPEAPVFDVGGVERDVFRK